jgi:hypothetical protein
MRWNLLGLWAVQFSSQKILGKILFPPLQKAKILKYSSITRMNYKCSHCIFGRFFFLQSSFFLYDHFFEMNYKFDSWVIVLS